MLWRQEFGSGIPLILGADQKKKFILSYFVPHKCDIPWTPTHQACKILSHYSNIVFVGESLMRYLRQAFFIILRDHDLIRGGIQTSTFIDMCQCDGQFSEHGVC